MAKKDCDLFTGICVKVQKEHVDDAYITIDGQFVVDAYNSANREAIDISHVSSMAAIYEKSTSFFCRKILPELKFVKREGPLVLSCVASLQPDATARQQRVRESKRQSGVLNGSPNLIRWVTSSGQAW